MLLVMSPTCPILPTTSSHPPKPHPFPHTLILSHLSSHPPTSTHPPPPPSSSPHKPPTNKHTLPPLLPKAHPHHTLYLPVPPPIFPHLNLPTKTRLRPICYRSDPISIEYPYRYRYHISTLHRLRINLSSWLFRLQFAIPKTQDASIRVGRVG